MCFNACSESLCDAKLAAWTESYNENSRNENTSTVDPEVCEKLDRMMTYLSPSKNAVYKDSMLLAFNSIFLLIEDINYGKANSELEVIKNDSHLNKDLTYLAHLKLSDTLSLSSVSYFMNKLYKSDDPYDKILEIVCLQELARLAERQDEFVVAQAMLHYGLSIIEASSINLDFLKARILQSMKMSMAQENESYIDRQIAIDKEVSSLLSQYKESDYIHYVNWFATSIDTSKDYIPIDTIIGYHIRDWEKVKMLTDHGVLKVEEDPTMALDYFMAAQRFFKDCPYHSYSKLIANYIGLCYELNSEFDKADLYFRDARQRDTAESDYQYDYSELMSIGFSLYFRNPHRSTKADRFSLLKAQRALAEKQVRYNDEHLNDFMASNTMMQLRLIKEDGDLADVQYIFDLLQTTNKYSDRRTTKKKHSAASLKLLSKVNSFRIHDKTKFEIYDDLLVQVLEDWMIQKPLTKPEVTPTDVATLSSKLIKEDAVFIDQLVYREVSSLLFYDGKKLTIKHSETAVLDSLRAALLTHLFAGKSTNQEIEDFHELLFEDKAKNYVTHFDTYFHDIPFGLFDVKSVRHVYSLDRYISESDVIIDSDSIGIVSYSDDQTLSSDDPLLITELPFGYVESKSIAAKVPGSKLIAGHDCTKANLLALFDYPLVHICTHGYSNRENKLENYLIVRDTDSELDSLYGFEIEALAKVPEVVILSGCKTGIGDHQYGEGNYSLARSFLSSGTQTCIKTLWNIDDEETQKFMTRLYGYWMSGASLAQALYQTQSDYRLHDIDAQIWSGFVLEGNSKIYYGSVN